MDLNEDMLLEKLTLHPVRRELPSDMKHIAFGTDRKYAKSMGVAITSILHHNPYDFLCIHILADELEPVDLERLKKLTVDYENLAVFLYYINVAKFKCLPMNENWAYAMYYRFLVPGFLHETTGRILYLDADILCVKSLQPLWNMDFDGNIVMAVNDTYLDGGAERAKKLGMSVDKYFNSGVLYIDVEAWKTAKISEHAMELLEQNGCQYTYWDQDVLNVLLEGKIKYIDFCWNTLYSLCSMKNSVDTSTAIIHYITGDKPWRAWTQYHEMAKLYISYVERSLWADFALTLPKTYKEMHRMAKCCWKQKLYAEMLYWYKKYIVMKLKKSKGRSY